MSALSLASHHCLFPPNTILVPSPGLVRPDDNHRGQSHFPADRRNGTFTYFLAVRSSQMTSSPLSVPATRESLTYRTSWTRLFAPVRGFRQGPYNTPSIQEFCPLVKHFLRKTGLSSHSRPIRPHQSPLTAQNRTFSRLAPGEPICRQHPMPGQHALQLRYVCRVRCSPARGDNSSRSTF